MISVVVFSYSEILESMLVEYAATEMGFLDDYSDADPNHKIIRGNGITTFLLNVAQYIIFNPTNRVKKITYCRCIVEVILFKLMFQGY